MLYDNPLAVNLVDKTAVVGVNCIRILCTKRTFDKRAEVINLDEILILRTSKVAFDNIVFARCGNCCCNIG